MVQSSVGRTSALPVGHTIGAVHHRNDQNKEFPVDDGLLESHVSV